MKTCPRCKESKKHTDFNKNARKKDGLQTMCRLCQRIVQNKWYAAKGAKHRKRNRLGNRERRRRNRKFLTEYLLEHPCADCGEANPVVLDFDHVKGKKKDAVTTLANNLYSIKKIKEEISKCEVVCANCHRIRTASRDKLHWMYRLL